MSTGTATREEYAPRRWSKTEAKLLDAQERSLSMDDFGAERFYLSRAVCRLALGEERSALADLEAAFELGFDGILGGTSFEATRWQQRPGCVRRS